MLNKVPSPLLASSISEKIETPWQRAMFRPPHQPPEVAMARLWDQATPQQRQDFVNIVGVANAFDVIVSIAR